MLTTHTLRSKVKGMIIGGAIGDARFMPFETMKPEQISQLDPDVAPQYFDPSSHRWFKNMKPGDVTDDTQLTIAVMKGLMRGDGFDLDMIAKAHVEAMQATTKGWGSTTVEAIRRLEKGVSWRESGKSPDHNRGTGNGVLMKIAPLAAWWAGSDKTACVNQLVVDFAAMTHYTTMAAYSALVHMWSLYDLLYMEPEKVDTGALLDLPEFIKDEGDPSVVTEENYRYKVDHLNSTEDDIFYPLRWLRENGELEDLTSKQIYDQFGGGTSYIYHSLPTCYAYFFRRPQAFQTVLDVGRAGGDTDTNAAIVGNMIGALHGIELFERPENRWALDGLLCYQELNRLVDTFCDQFKIT